MCILFSFGEWISKWWNGVKDPLKDAGINSIIGLVVVFLVLAFISLIISLLKYTNVLGKKDNADNNLSAVNPADPSDGINYFELVAILTAAITEYEEAQGHFFKDGMTICSIKKF